MKIVFTGGGTGGHFYPLIAIAESIHEVVRERRLVPPKIFFIGPSAFDKDALFENNIRFLPCPAGKWRRYFSPLNFLDLFVTAWGTLTAFFTLFSVLPDVVVSKGGYASVPVTSAARLLGIPVVIHESDSKPGRANLIASKFAKRIAVASESSIQYFPAKVRDRIAHTGIPLRSVIRNPEIHGACEHFGIAGMEPVILILGGSSGAERVNDVVLAALPELTTFAHVIHQTGAKNFPAVERMSKLMLEKSAHPERYHPYPYLNAPSMRRAAGAADLVISRAGMTAIAEIAAWKKPSILIPIPESVSHDQRTNAYAYTKTGAASMLEEANLTEHLLVSEARRILTDPAVAAGMIERTAAFSNANAGRLIADEVVNIALSHEAK